MDILTNLYNAHGFDRNGIKTITFGALYTCIELQNGNIGVCATLKEVINEIPTGIDVNRFVDRVVLQAYFNALLNYDVKTNVDCDIFDSVDFRKYKNTVMIGYFRPLAAKFFSNNLPHAIFDLDDDSKELTPMNKHEETLQECDALIMSATAITNHTYLHILSSIPSTCDVYLLGPSSSLDTAVFKVPNIKAVFGSRFQKSDTRVHEAIRNGGGNKAFSGFAEKVGVNKGER